MIHICFNRLFPFDPLNSILCCTCTCINTRGNYVHLYKIVCFSILYTYLRSFFKIIFSFQSSFIQYIYPSYYPYIDEDLPMISQDFCIISLSVLETSTELWQQAIAREQVRDARCCTGRTGV